MGAASDIRRFLAPGSSNDSRNARLPVTGEPASLASLQFSCLAAADGVALHDEIHKNKTRQLIDRRDEFSGLPFQSSPKRDQFAAAWKKTRSVGVPIPTIDEIGFSVLFLARENGRGERKEGLVSVSRDASRQMHA